MRRRGVRETPPPDRFEVGPEAPRAVDARSGCSRGKLRLLFHSRVRHPSDGLTPLDAVPPDAEVWCDSPHQVGVPERVLQGFFLQASQDVEFVSVADA